MAQFKVWTKDADSGLVIDTDHEVGINDSEAIRAIKELSETTGTHVAAMDPQAADILITPKRKPSEWTAELTQFTHEQFLAGTKTDEIHIKIFTEFGVLVTANSVQRTIKQQSNAHFQIADGLRDQVVAMRSANGSGAKNGLTDEEREIITTDFEAGLSGAAIGRKIGRNSSTVNKFIREHLTGGYRAEHLKMTANANLRKDPTVDKRTPERKAEMEAAKQAQKDAKAAKREEFEQTEEFEQLQNGGKE